jgi:hypothetical protein
MIGILQKESIPFFNIAMAQESRTKICTSLQLNAAPVPALDPEPERILVVETTRKQVWVSRKNRMESLDWMLSKMYILIGMTIEWYYVEVFLPRDITL